MKAAYVVSFLTTLVSVVALMAPTVYHRLRWRERNKERMLRAANLSTIVGMTALAVAMTAAVYLVIDSVVSQAWAIVMTDRVRGRLRRPVAGSCPSSAPYDRWDDHLDEDGRTVAARTRRRPLARLARRLALEDRRERLGVDVAARDDADDAAARRRGRRARRRAPARRRPRRRRAPASRAAGRPRRCRGAARRRRPRAAAARAPTSPGGAPSSRRRRRTTAR